MNLYSVLNPIHRTDLAPNNLMQGMEIVNFSEFFDAASKRSSASSNNGFGISTDADDVSRQATRTALPYGSLPRDSSHGGTFPSPSRTGRTPPADIVADELVVTQRLTPPQFEQPQQQRRSVLARKPKHSGSPRFLFSPNSNHALCGSDRQISQRISF